MENLCSTHSLGKREAPAVARPHLIVQEVLRLPAAATRRLLASVGLAVASLIPLSASESQAYPTEWDLNRLYAGSDAWREAKEAVALSVSELPGYAGRLGEGAGTLLEAMERISNTSKELVRVYVHASLASDEDTRNSEEQERVSEAAMLYSQFSRSVSYFNPEILELGETIIQKFLLEEPGLAPYAFTLKQVLDRAPHTLGSEAESVLSATGLMSGAASSIYGILANADLPWPAITLADGTEATLDQAGYTRWRGSNNRDDREAVFRAFWGKMKEYERTFGTALFSQVKNDWFYASVRKFPNCLASALADDQIPEAVYRTLLAETRNALPTLHRYLKLRGKLLEIDDLRYWDMYPSIVALEKEFSYEQGARLSLEAAAPLGDAYCNTLENCLTGPYTHVYPKSGKRSGAYMSGSAYDVHPFVLLNFNGDYESVTTLAHEWGHGMHSRLSNASQSWENSRYSIFVAEIASTLNEALLLDHLLKNSTSDEEKLYYLGSAVEGFRQTFFRQAMFADFELAIHEVVEKGGALSGPRLTQIYGDMLRDYHGHSEGVVTIDDLVAIEWAYIPHFYRAFYVFQYATSIAAAQAFAEKILNEEPGALETYLELLKAGGSDYAYDLVKKAGVDLATPEPYLAFVARMNRYLDQIEEILAKRAAS